MDLLKVMIADDETILRELLVTTVKWEALGLKVCCEARNGQEAFEKAKDFVPDIALIDINMPCIDGLTLTEKLKELFPQMVIVLITGHSEFEYARKAIKLGVMDYILKPFSDEELEKVLQKSIATAKHYQEENTTAGNTRQIIRDNLLNSLINLNSTYDGQDILKHLPSLGMETTTNTFIVFTAEIDNVFSRSKDADEVLQWKNAVHNIADEILKETGNNFIFFAPQDRIVAIAELKPDISIRNFISIYLSKICNVVEKHLSFTITIGLGNLYPGLSCIKNSYQEALIALQNKIMLGNNRVIFYSDIESSVARMGFHFGELTKDIALSLRTNDLNNIKLKIDNIFNYIKQNQSSLENTYMICTVLISICLSYITETGNSAADILGSSFSPMAEMSVKESIEVLHSWILDIFTTTAEKCSRQKNSSSKRIADSVRGYIDINYSNSEISLEQLAAHFHLNSDYLRSAFRKEMGMTVIDYLTKVRMVKAKELLYNGIYKLSGIAEMVGYSDPGYFSKCFKKFYGASPSDYEVFI